MIRFVVPGAAKGKQRARGGRYGHYTPQQTVNAEAFVKLCAMEAMAGAPPMEGSLIMVINIDVTPPASFNKKRRADCLVGLEHPTSKPDCDNAAKLFMDALNGLAYGDDKQISRLVVNKEYAELAQTTVVIKRREAGEP